jgi:hypothetical protein
VCVCVCVYVYININVHICRESGKAHPSARSEV